MTPEVGVTPEVVGAVEALRRTDSARCIGISRTVVLESGTTRHPAEAPVALRVWKHSRQKTGRP
ncbi:MAG TPA: hypothetical protein VGL82_20185 [Bryobacteraceae bacterium]